MKYEDQCLEYKILNEIPSPQIVDSKQLANYKEKKKWKPSANHPWKRNALDPVAL